MGAIRCQIWLHKSLKHNHPRNVQVFRKKIALFPIRTYSRWRELKLSIFVLTPTWGHDPILLTVIEWLETNQRLKWHCRPQLGQAAMFLCIEPPLLCWILRLHSSRPSNLWDSNTLIGTVTMICRFSKTICLCFLLSLCKLKVNLFVYIYRNIYIYMCICIYAYTCMTLCLYIYIQIIHAD